MADKIQMNMKYRDLKIGQKLIASFALIASIALIVGIVGLVGLRSVGRSFHQVSDVNMPSVQHLMEIETSLEGLMVAMRTILNPNLTSNDRMTQLRIVGEMRERYTNAIEAYEKLPMSAEATVLWGRFRDAISQWRQMNEGFQGDIERLNRLDIHYPMAFLRDIGGFHRSQSEMQLGALTAIQTGRPFAGQNDHAQSDFGRWLLIHATTNPTINATISGMREYHVRLYRAISDINNAVQRGDRATANVIYQQELMTSVEALNRYFVVLNEQGNQAAEILTRMERVQMVDVMPYLNEVIAGINQIIDYNLNAANNEVRGGDRAIAASYIMMILAVLIGLVVASALALLISRAITGGLKKGVAMAEQVAAGNLAVVVDNKLLAQKDEVGQLARSLQQMTEQLREIIGDILSGADNIAAASQEMSGTSQQMSQGASEQASSAEEVSSSMEEMVANIQQNTDNALETEKIAIQAVQGIRRGTESTDIAVRSMREIASKVSIIGDIAFQTNMLALNAAVEAARAGEHGKGFAVVAEEVRKLAERSQIAAEEIDVLSENGVRVSEDASQQLAAIVPEIEKTARLVQEIAAASMEQNSGAEQVNNAIQQLNQVIQQNAAASEEMASSSEELSGQAEQMKDVVSFFIIENKEKKSRSAKMRHHIKNGSRNRAESVDVVNPKEVQTVKGVNLKMSVCEVNDDDYQRF